jgi:hypothetical protein
VIKSGSKTLLSRRLAGECMSLFIEERGDRELAMEIRRLAEEGQKGP